MTKLPKILLTVIISFLVVFVNPVKADVIYHAFNMPFRDIQAQIPELKAQGYTYVQISPPQLSNPSSQWWARYQPVDFTVIDGPLGNENDLKQLIDTAHEQGEKIIVDLVINHMANDGEHNKNLQYPRFSAQDFHPKTCIQNYDDHYQATHGWLGGGCDLPDLNTESPYVRQELKNYVAKLLNLGADGFRIDALKHIGEDSLAAIFSDVPNEVYIYGEIVEGQPKTAFTYTPVHGIDVTDYPLLSTMKNAFAPGGDLHSLINPVSFNGALPGVNAVTFAKTHDTVPGRDLFPSFGMDPRDSILANAFLLARADGLPLIYPDDAPDPIVKAGVLFHEQMIGKLQKFRNGNEIAPGGDSPNLLFIERGDQGLAIINKSGQVFDSSVTNMPGLAAGCYQELNHGFTISVDQGDNGQKVITRWDTEGQRGIHIPSRDALFFVKCS